jgi:alkylation response protein AidB-like acyl-CoA dehydrogenase
MTQHVPAPDRTSFWERDEVARRGLSRALGPDEFARAEETFAAVGAAAADELDRLGSTADREPPWLNARDPAGERIDEVVYHPAYRRLEDLAYREFRLVGVKYDADARARGVAQRLGFGRTLLYGMGEAGVLCPVCMTDGVGRVIEASGDQALIDEVVPKLCFGPGEARNTGAMFLTEKAGGSDVGKNETVARETADGWRLSGEKWFCSNVDAEQILALARPEGAPPGTRGLGLFLVQRRQMEGAEFRIERLKPKLGTRSMPTGEVVLTDAPARLVGPVDQGFKQMAGMLNTSRLYNAVVSCAAIGRAWLESTSWLERRVAFGKPVAQHPLGAEVLAELEAEYAGCLALVLDAVTAMDRLDGGDAEAGALLRALTPLIKLFTAKVAVAAASEAVECLGGVGYTEDWSTPRLLRDAQVLPIWEGTTNVLVLDLLRVGAKGGLDVLFQRARRGLEASSAGALAPARDAVAARLAAAGAGFQAMAAGDLAPGRRHTFSLARALETALLLEAAEGEPDGPEGRAALRLAQRAGGPGIGCA